MGFRRFLSASNEHPYLGVPDGQISAGDVSDLPRSATCIELEEPCANFELISSFKRLRDLSLSQVDQSWFRHLAGCPKLRILRLNGLKNASLPSFASLANLRSLVLFRCAKLSSLSFLRHIKDLHSLCISECPLIRDLGPLDRLTELRELWIDSQISRSTKIKSLKPVGKLSQLQYLQFYAKVDGKTSRLDPLAGLQKLNTLQMSNGFSDAEYRVVLDGCPKLKEIRFSGGKSFPKKKRAK